jgi:N-acetylmuramoyl-L-alanine amidase
VLAIALKLGELIEKQNPDVKVVYTRKTDEFLELYQRANIANKAKADLFLSIHANSTTKKDPNGLEFFVLGPHKNDDNLEVAKKENAVVKLESNVAENYGFDPNSPDGHIMMTMKQSLYLDNSIQLAKKIEGEFIGDANQAMRGVKQAGFVVLYQTAMPSCLIEVGFISNPKEEEYINSEAGQNAVASKIAKAFSVYKNKYEKNATKEPIKTENNKSNDAEKPKFKSALEASQNTVNAIKKTEVIRDSVAETPKKKVIYLENYKEAKAVDEAKNRILNQKIAEEKSNPKVDSIENIENAAEPKSNFPFKKITSKEEILEKSISKVEEEPKKVAEEMFVEFNNTTKNTKPIHIKDSEAKKEIENEAFLHFGTKQEPIVEKPIIKEEKPTPSVAVKPKTNYSSDEIVFYIQLLASAKKLSTQDKIFKDFRNVRESFETGMYKYLIGESTQLENVQKAKEDAKNKGYKDVFVVKYKNGVRIK